MKFQKNTRRKPIEYEKDLVNYWKKNEIFEKSVEQRPKDNRYVFYDGPPFITGVPHHGTLLSSIIKDAVPRYWTMKGRRVERVWGWDTHGLPAEVFTEKKLGIKDRRDIGTKISLEKYITTARENMVVTGGLWEQYIDRIGRWVDFRGAYKTMDKEYMESIWWAFKTLHEKGKIYEGERVLMYCIRDATPLSKAEVTMDAGAYQDVTDPSVYAKFKLADSDKVLLVWTTVPWTLLANTGLAVHKDETYAEVQVGDEVFVIAKPLIEDTLKNEKGELPEYKITREFKGEELVGKRYEPFYKDWGEGAHLIHHADFVSVDEGTGIVSQAPAYGEEDFELAKEKGFPVVSVIDDSGILQEGEFKDTQVWDTNKDYAKSLLESGKVYRINYYRHSYPHCHRCGTKLIYRAHPSWFFDVQNQKQEMLAQNSEVINWFPEHLKHGRFQKNIEQAPDWNLSRDRFWATAMPVWEGIDEKGDKHQIVIGSYAELKDLSGVELDDYHRPWVDGVEFDKDGVHYKRIDKVLDGWFESGSMPFAQFHYPFENKEKFEQNFPGDFIAEYIGQVRAWFYYLHVVNVGLFGKAPFKNVVTTGNLMGNDGYKLSKSRGNYTDPNEVMDKYSADAERFLLLNSPVLKAEDFSLQDKDVGDVARKLNMIWNMYDFFTMYAEVDGWEWNGKLDVSIDSLTNPLDIWVVSRLHQLISEVEKQMDNYNLPDATSLILPFVDDASNWYVRRSRRRFWKSGDDADKQDAYKTLHYVLTQLAIVMAPFTPFLSEELYRKLTDEESVHLVDWPEAHTADELLVEQMAQVRRVINEALSQRAANSLKIRQPLAKLTINAQFEVTEEMQEIIKEEVNVKSVIVKSAKEEEIKLDTDLTQDLIDEGTVREVIRHIQNFRKTSGFDVDDRIELALFTTDIDVNRALGNYADEISHETLAKSLAFEAVEYAYTTKLSLKNTDLHLSLKKV